MSQTVMRSLIAGWVLFVASAPSFAQIALVRSVDFLQGIWVTDDTWGRTTQTAEFHWTGRQGNAILMGRYWSGEARDCPWCVSQAVMTAYYDSAANEVHVRLSDKTQRTMDFLLVSARSKSAQFLSVAGADQGTYRLTYELPAKDDLVITLERTESITEPVFSRVARWRFHRPNLIHPS